MVANLERLAQKSHEVANLDRLFWESPLVPILNKLARHLVVNLDMLVWEHPLVLNLDKLALDPPVGQFRVDGLRG